MQRLDPSSSVGIPLPLPPQAASARPVEVPTWKKIDQAVKTAPLFAYVKNKMNIISPLCAMSHPAIPAEVERIVHLMNNGPMTILDLPFRNPPF